MDVGHVEAVAAVGLLGLQPLELVLCEGDALTAFEDLAVIVVVALYIGLESPVFSGGGNEIFHQRKGFVVGM